MAAMAPLTKKPAPKGKKKSLTFTVDCSKPVDDQIMDIAAFEKFLSEKIKVSGKAGARLRFSSRYQNSSRSAVRESCSKWGGVFAGNLGDNVKVSRDKSKVTVTSDSQMSKRCARNLRSSTPEQWRHMRFARPLAQISVQLVAP